MPDAPVPCYDADGNRQLEWLIILRYDPSRGVTTLSWNKDGDLYRKTKRGAVAWDPKEAGDILEGVRKTFYMLSDPSLF